VGDDRTELGAARREEAEEEAREQQLYRGLADASASSSPAASSAHVRVAAPRAASWERLRATLPWPRESAERETEVVAHPLGSSHGGATAPAS